ncbi:glycerol-3-phosphate dehydrogenase, partial [Candidatus Saccharibacteria bacterium]|nr:glycerol-3-phosphate dehydrogenase [Candidatus Saccharibacteria bacterium]
MKITFLGAGVFGSALAKIAEENGHEIRFYDPYKYPDITLSDA